MDDERWLKRGLYSLLLAHTSLHVPNSQLMFEIFVELEK